MNFTRTSVLCVLLLFVPRIAYSGEEETSRIRQLFGFTSQLLDRRLTGTDHYSLYGGDRPFRTRDVHGEKVLDSGKEQFNGLMTASRDVVELIEVGPIPITSESQMTKVKITHGRVCNINFVGSHEKSGIEWLTESPKAVAAQYANDIGGGPWLGYFLAPELPPWETLLTGEWTSTPDGMLTCLFGDRQIAVAFDPVSQDRPLSVEINVAVKGLEKQDDSYIRSRFIEFKKWTTQEGVEFPSVVSIWDLQLDSKTGWMTSHSDYEIVGVSPVIKVSDKYGDFFTDVPNGQPVHVDDYLGIDFIWQDGEIVRKIDRVKLASLIGQPFFGSPFRRYLMMALGLCVLAGVGWFIWRRPNRAEAPPLTANRVR